MTVEDEQPLSPFSRMMHVPGMNLSVLTVLGFATTIDLVYFKKCLEQTIMRHPRFSSVLVIKDEKRRDYWWKRATPNVDDHIIIPDLNQDMKSPDIFVEDYTSRISKNPYDLTKPLWEVHVLNVKTSEANATVICRIHHSIGDGVALTSILIACGRKISDPESLPEFPSRKKKAGAPPVKGLVKRMFSFVWMTIMMVYYTLLHIFMAAAICVSKENSSDPFRGSPETNQSETRYVHRIISLEDVKFIKNEMNTTVNDVLVAATQVGLVKYLQKQYGIQRENDETMQKTCDIIAKLGVSLNVAINLRASASIEETADVIFKGKKLNRDKWGNYVTPMSIPLKVFKDPLKYVQYVKACMDKIKVSWKPQHQLLLLKFYVYLFGVEFAVKMLDKFNPISSVAFSNVFGPQEEIFLFGHPLTYIAPTASGMSIPLIIHYQSYAKRLIICLAANEKSIPDPHEVLDCLQSSMESIKDNAIKRGHDKDLY